MQIVFSEFNTSQLKAPDCCSKAPDGCSKTLDGCSAALTCCSSQVLFSSGALESGSHLSDGSEHSSLTGLDDSTLDEDSWGADSESNVAVSSVFSNTERN